MPDIKDISVIIPLYNDEEVFTETLKRVTGVLETFGNTYEIVFVDDGSSDQTRNLLEKEATTNKKVKAIIFSRNFGHQAAISAGLKHSKGKAVVVMDSDLQDPPELIPKMYSLLKAGNDVVYAVRKTRKENLVKRFCYYAFYRLARIGSGQLQLPLDAGDFSLMSRRVVDHINNFPERNRYVRGIRSWVGFRQIGIPYERGDRYAGVSKYSTIKLFKIAYDGLFAFTELPLLIVNILGIVFSTISFLGIILVLGLRLFTSAYIPGFASTAIIILFIGGIQLLMLGIVGEYIKRLYDETKQRPLYIIDNAINLHD